MNGGNTETTLYLGGLMEKVTDSTGTNYRHYIYAQTNTAAVAILSRTSGGTNATYYVLDDHQQSPSTLRNASGALVVNESHTAYGARRNWSTWSGSASATELTTSSTITRQGYTWQTALGTMGLNHMNGRVQDAITGIFLSPDPYISEPTNTQNYNRYSYVYNNPLSLTDPSGFWACELLFGYTFAGGTGSGVYGPAASGFSGGGALDSTPTQSGTWKYKATTTTVVDESGNSMTGNGGNWFFTPDLIQRTMTVDPSTLLAANNYTPSSGGGGSTATTQNQTPQCLYEDDDDSWAITFGGYFGTGFEITFGEDHGNNFATLRVGFGGGGGISYDPNPSIPGPEPIDRNTSGWVLSASGQLNFNAGPIGTNVELGAARNYNNQQSSIYGGGSASGVFQRKGISASASAAGQLTYYGKKTKSFANKGTCHL